MIDPLETPVTGRIRALLDEVGAEWRELVHAPTRTSAESAAARGESMSIGGKALVIKLGEDFALFVLPANRRLSTKALRKHLRQRRTRFASGDELDRLTGLVPGSVPPFGEPVLPLPVYVDELVWASSRIAFNAGSLRVSFLMQGEHWRRAVSPAAVFSFSDPEPEAQAGTQSETRS